MRKFTTIFTATLLACSLAACGGSKTPASSGSASAMEQLAEDASPAEKVIADFTDKVNSGSYQSLEDLAAAMSEADYLPFAPAYMQVEPGYLNGFTEEITGFEEGFMFGPSIGSIPFVGYVFTVGSEAEAADLIKKLNASADLNWNICTQADEMKDASVGKTVCFVMSPATFEE